MFEVMCERGICQPNAFDRRFEGITMDQLKIVQDHLAANSFWLRWRSPSLVASSRRSGGSTGLPRFEVLDQVFLPPASGRSFVGGASAWFFLPLWLTAVSLACGLAFAVLLGGGGFPRGY